MVKRSRLEIYLDVLEAVASGIEKPTRIMYATNLSWKPTQKIIEFLINQGLIKEFTVGKRRRYEITEKGLDVLKYFRRIQKILITT